MGASLTHRLAEQEHRGQGEREKLKEEEIAKEQEQQRRGVAHQSQILHVT